MSVKKKIQNWWQKGVAITKSDKNPLQRQLNKQAGIGNTTKASGRIQKKLMEGGWEASDLRRKKEAATKKKNDARKMARLKKNNPSKYKQLKKEQRKKERLKAFSERGNSSTWD
tara:strand:+ start:40 stop:381 length:342 start_codon:yes stop_codon:yes gene_type:complete